VPSATYGIVGRGEAGSTSAARSTQRRGLDPIAVQGSTSLTRIASTRRAPTGRCGVVEQPWASASSRSRTRRSQLTFSDRRGLDPALIARPHLVREHGAVFYRLDHEVEEVTGVPTELNERLVAGELDLAPISSIAWARDADRLRILPRLCVSSEGAVDSIQLVSACRSSRSRRWR
jgi:hypothetical protein